MKYFTSDWHLGHERILQLAHRNFGSIEEHDKVILDNLNTLVGRNDVLYVLGDISWPSFRETRQYIRCRQIFYIRGNHDKPTFDKYFTDANDVQEIKVQGHKVFLSHYPHLFWPSSHYGSFHLYGHLHDQREAWMDNLIPDRRSMDVGVDAAKRILGSYSPFNENRIVEILGSRKGHDHVDWYIEQDRLRYGS